MPTSTTHQEKGALSKEEITAAHVPPASTRALWRIVVVVAVVLGVAIAFAIHSRSAGEARLRRDVAVSAILSVHVVHPKEETSSDEITLPGNALAFQDTSIYARTSGYLRSWKVDIGAHVKEGDVLAEIETPEVDQQLNQARANLKNAQANLQIAQITADRSENLFKTKTISSQERDLAKSDLAAKEALVDSNEANVKRLEHMQAFQKIYAPFDGVVTARNTDIGNLIQAGDSSGGRELFHLADNRTLRVYFSVPEVYASSIQAGAQLPIVFDAFPGESFTGKLMRDTATIDPRSHTLTAEADVENPSGRLFPGGYATVHLKLPPTPGAVRLPANTLLFRSEGTQVGVVRDGRIALVTVSIGHDFGNIVEIVKGVTPADAVILDPPDSLAEGAAVRIENAPAK
ncbi:MAG TPA: efflux RND transporter periplasmic adaptor subunit [Chthoniobacteraceae bacterium]|jgi:RND family efflux transporter MFP subunit|nr:efflux RND transporter periplasmic adaptor subunit [Chthoniobacteraceae bacterium]